MAAADGRDDAAIWNGDGRKDSGDYFHSQNHANAAGPATLNESETSCRLVAREYLNSSVLPVADVAPLSAHDVAAPLVT